MPATATQSPLPAEFVTWIQGYVLSSHYTTARRLQRGLILRWSLWQDGHPANALPGYPAPPPATRHGYPAGWTVRNLQSIARTASSLKTEH